MKKYQTKNQNGSEGNPKAKSRGKYADDRWWENAERLASGSMQTMSLSSSISNLEN